MSDTVRQLAEREAAASRVMARADQLAALSETADALTRVYLMHNSDRNSFKLSSRKVALKLSCCSSDAI